MDTICYSVYLEVASDRRCMAHILDLPGCIVRAQTREQALQRLPAAIRDHHAWLRDHREPAPPPDVPIEVRVAAETTGGGPFDPGDAAALFAPDREAVTSEEMAWHFRLLSHSRADLLDLVRDLPSELLDWQPDPQAFSIRQVLRHVGNSEQWYVSRLVPPETLPADWDDDEHLPLFTFLEMERRTAVLRLEQLTAEERSATFYPAAWTQHPGEPWTVRKALRRALEHEREHTAQVWQILDARRHWLLARLAAARAGLLEQLIDADERALTTRPITGDWTALDLLAHIVAWDRWQNRTMRNLIAGVAPDLTALADMDESNAAFVAAWRERAAGLSRGEALQQVLFELREARLDWVAWLDSLAVPEFFRLRHHAGEDWSFGGWPLRIMREHENDHGRQMASWREAAGGGHGVASKAVLLAALDAARDELLAASALVAPEERATRPVCGTWTLKDVLGHIADWEQFGLEGLRDMAAGRPPRGEPVRDIDVWNRVHVQARRGQPWDRVWADLQAAREALAEVLTAMDQEGLGRPFPFPWGGLGTPQEWACVYLAHDREHALGLRGEEGVEAVEEC